MENSAHTGGRSDEPSKVTPEESDMWFHEADRSTNWKGLSFDDLPNEEFGDQDFLRGARWAETQLKEKNHD